ncbi:MAG: hypothetical protein ACE5K9_06295 [Candidatus Methylomirabilales bacterium]
MRLLRWSTSPEQGSGEEATADSGYPEGSGATEAGAEVFSWSSSPTLEKVYHGLTEQQRIIEELKRYLEERLTPFQRYLGWQRVSVDNALKTLERRLKPLRQYIQGETTNLERVSNHLEAGLREQFEAFEELLASQRDFLEQANRYIEGQPQPFLKYVEDGRRGIEMIYGALQQRLDAFLQNLGEQQQILDSLREPALISEYDALAEYLEERQKALAQFARAVEYRPTELFSQLDEAAERHKPPRQDQNTLFARVFEQARLADQRFREAITVPEPSPPNRDLVRGQLVSLERPELRDEEEQAG